MDPILIFNSLFCFFFFFLASYDIIFIQKMNKPKKPNLANTKKPNHYSFQKKKKKITTYFTLEGLFDLDFWLSFFRVKK